MNSLLTEHPSYVHLVPFSTQVTRRVAKWTCYDAKVETESLIFRNGAGEGNRTLVSIHPLCKTAF
jgi:hypothetical protein